MSAKKILIVDYDSDRVLGLGIRLRAYGYEVFSAMDGVTAISTAQKELPELVLLDLGLPAGDGYWVLDRMKSLLPLAAVPVIVLSARDPASNKERARKAGALAFFPKPAENEILAGAIRRVLESSPRRGSESLAGASR